MTYIGYITGPRAEQPVGVRVVEPPPNTRQAQRGNLYVVLELVGEHPDRNAISDRLLSEVLHVYYAAKGSQSQVMVEAVQQAQQLLREVNAHTPQYPLQLSCMCAALLGMRLLVASTGAAFALVRASDKVHMFPSDPSATLGNFAAAPVEVYRQDVLPDDALFLGGGSWLRRLSARTLASVVAFVDADNCTDAADELYRQAGAAPLPGLIIVLAVNEAPPPRDSRGGPAGGNGGRGYPSGGPSGQPPVPNLPRRRPPRFGGLPTALGAPPPAQVASSAQVPPPDQPSTSAPTSPAPTSTAASPQPPSLSNPLVVPSVNDAAGVGGEEPLGFPVMEVDRPLVEAQAAAEPPSAQAPSAQAPSAQAPSAQAPSAPLQVSATAMLPAPVLPAEPGAEVEPIFPAAPTEPAEEGAPSVPRGPGVGERVAAGLTQATRFLTRMLPERGAPPVENPLRSAPQTGMTARGVTGEAADWGAPQQARAPAAPPLEMGEAAESASPVLPVSEMPPFAPPQPTQGARARLFLLASLLLIVLVPAVVMVLNLTEGGNRRATAEEATARAELILAGAQAVLDQGDLDQGDKVTARERLAEAQALLAEAIELDGMNERRSRLIATIEAEQQEVLQVIPLYGLTEPLITFPAEARPQRVLVVNEDIFVLDAGRQALLQYRFDPTTGFVNDQLGQVILQQGDTVGDASVGTLVDMAWLPLIPNVEDRASLLITDRNNNLFRFDLRVEGATRTALVDQATWGSVGQVQVYNGRIYLADEARGTLLRYNPVLPDAPGDAWFSPDVRVDLTGLLAMEIDGDIWLLYSNGMLLRYQNGQQVPFSPENSIGLAEEPVDMFVTRQESATIYVADAGQERILVYAKATGAYLGQLRAPEEGLLQGLAGLYIDEVTGRMFILAQSGLFAHPLLP